ncbi:MAG: AAA family ATPase [Acidimicrobiia bacterium]|nr:AAA family ATPase [Acidimicrobiia bacterium]
MLGASAARRCCEGRTSTPSPPVNGHVSGRLAKLAVLLGPLALWLWARGLSGDPVSFGWPDVPAGNSDLLIAVGLMVMLVLVVGLPLVAAGHSPHVVLRPADSAVRLGDVVGAEATKREAVDTLNLFLAHRTFASELGGQPRRGVLFEGPPGTGKTYLAKAMAGEAGVPFLFVSASAFQSMYYGQTNRKVRSYFKALRREARREGGAIGFIEEFDAIGGARSNMGSGASREGVTGVVNELLVQMQSFDLPSGRAALAGRLVDLANLWLPLHRHLSRPATPQANVLVVAATNRAADLDPALMRPGRFDRIVHFGLPPRRDREAIAAYYLGRKSHGPDVAADAVAGLTSGYTPVRIERLLDEALVCALRRGGREMRWPDVLEAKLVTELGLSHDDGYEPVERRRIATHEAAHALVATLVGRRVTVASILRRSDALGLVAHDDAEERLLSTPSEAKGLMQVALAGMVAEELEWGEASSGISSDLAAATTVAAQLVGALGAGGSRLSLEAASMAGGNLVAKVLGDETSRRSAERLMAEAEAATRGLVERHRSALRALTDALLAGDELSGDEVREVLARHGAEVAPRAAAPR